MLEMEASVRDQINDDRDCTETALRLMGLRQELTTLVSEWSRLGGAERLPPIREKLPKNYRATRGLKFTLKRSAARAG
jgi:hypothetical protein